MHANLYNIVILDFKPNSERSRHCFYYLKLNNRWTVKGYVSAMLACYYNMESQIEASLGEMKWIGIEWDEMGWDGTGRDGTGRDGMG